MFLTIHGHGANDSLSFDDSNDPVPGDITWSLSESIVNETNIDFTSHAFMYSNIQNLIIAGNDNRNIFDVSPTTGNLDDMPRNLALDQPFEDGNYSIVINDQSNGEHTDAQRNLQPTNWVVDGTSATRTYTEESAFFPGLNVVVQRRISFNNSENSNFSVAIHGGGGDDIFLVQPTVASNGVNNFDLLPSSLAVDGGGGTNGAGTNSLQIDDSAGVSNAWTLDSGRVAGGGSVTSFSNVGQVEIDANGDFIVKGT